MWSALHWYTTIFEGTVLLLKLYDGHDIVTESLLNLPDNFHLRIIKLLAQFDAKLLISSQQMNI